MVKELENFSLPLFRDNRREDLPPGLFICTDFYTAFFHYIIFQQTVEKLTWYPKAKPKLASGSWLFTSIASLLHTNWKDVDSTVKYCCRLLRSYYFMTCESVLQENYYFCNTTLLKSVFSGGRPSELHHNIHTISGIYFLPIKHELMCFWWHLQELMRLTSASGLLVFLYIGNSCCRCGSYMTFADLPHEIRSYLLKGVVRGTQILTVLDTGQKAYIVSNNYISLATCCVHY